MKTTFGVGHEDLVVCQRSPSHSADELSSIYQPCFKPASTPRTLPTRSRPTRSVSPHTCQCVSENH